MDGSNGKIVELLERTAAGQDGLREEMHGMREEIQAEIQGLRTETRADSRSLRAEMRDGFNKVDSRLDHMLKFLGGDHADHEQRIVALEDHVLGKRKNS